MNLVPFNNDSALPAYLQAAGAMLDINKEVVRTAPFPSLSIKGMKFTIVKDNVKKIITKPDDDEEIAQSIGIVILRANMNARTFYAKKYVEGESDGARPDCHSFDGVSPSPHAVNPQAKKCAACPHAVWGSRMGDGDREGDERKGTACAANIRLAVSAPDKLEPMLLRVPPKSISPLKTLFKTVAARKVPYNAAVIKVGFNRDEPSPVLTFKPIGLMDDAGYKQVTELYDGETVRAIMGLDDLGLESAEAPKPAIETDELDAAIAARDASKKAKESSAPPVERKKAPKPVAADDDEDDAAILAPKKAKVVEPDPEPAPAPKKAKAAVEDDEPVDPPKVSKGASNLLADLDDLLGEKDD
jgi:hypothetical protein